MTRLYALIHSIFVPGEEGQGLAEYALLLSLIARRLGFRTPIRTTTTSTGGSGGGRGRPTLPDGRFPRSGSSPLREPPAAHGRRAAPGR